MLKAWGINHSRGHSFRAIVLHMFGKKTHTSRGGGVLKKMSKEIEETFVAFDVPIEIEEAIEGLRSYHFYIKPKKPTRMKVFHTFIDDLRYALSTDKVDIQAPIPDTKLIGITVPKKEEPPKLDWEEAIKDFEYDSAKPLVVPFGCSELGEPYEINLTRMPHLLLGGSTSSGKSVLLNSIISSLLYNNSPEKLRLILVDPKRVELTLYNGIPHLLTDVITDPKKALLALKWAVKETERRYDILQSDKVRDIDSYHKLVYNPSKKQFGKRGSLEKDLDELPEPMPYIVIAFDELSELMATYPREFESTIVRICQMSRAVGIHLIMSTQRPEVKVITGLMKANIPSRIAMKVNSVIDSRTIMDIPGAEKLSGQGDMLFQCPDYPIPQLLQSYMIEEETIREQVKKLRIETDKVQRDTINLTPSPYADPSSYLDLFEDGEDDLYEEVREAVIKAGKASTSFLQRTFRIGYSRAARLMDLLEERGVIGSQDGSAPREVLED